MEYSCKARRMTTVLKEVPAMIDMEPRCRGCGKPLVCLSCGSPSPPSDPLEDLRTLADRDCLCPPLGHDKDCAVGLAQRALTRIELRATA